MFNPKYSRSVTFSALRPSALPIWKCKKRPTEHPSCCEASILAAFSQGAGLTPQSWKGSNCLGAGLSFTGAKVYLLYSHKGPRLNVGVRWGIKKDIKS